MNKTSSYAPILLRFAIGLVYLWFGSSQLLDPLQWEAFVPSWALYGGITSHTLVYFNGIFEVIMALLLLLGIYTRIVASLLFVHLLTITLSIGFNAIGVRDFGLTFATLSIALYGDDKYSLTR